MKDMKNISLCFSFIHKMNTAEFKVRSQMQNQDIY